MSCAMIKHVFGHMREVNSLILTQLLRVVRTVTLYSVMTKDSHTDSEGCDQIAWICIFDTVSRSHEFIFKCQS